MDSGRRVKLPASKKCWVRIIIVRRPKFEWS
jgi:hypothetical protein